MRKLKMMKGLLIGGMAAASVLTTAMPVFAQSDNQQVVSQESISTIIADVNADNFPDEIFRNYVSENFDTDQNNALSQSEIDAVKSIGLYGRDITSLKGIEIFTELEELYCLDSKVSELDVSSNTKLKTLHAFREKREESDRNIIEKIDISNNPNIESLWVSGNKLENLDVRNCLSLKGLQCTNNKIGELDLSNNSNLTSLDVRNNNLKSLNLDNNIQLESVQFSGNPIEKINLSNNKNLNFVWPGDNRLCALDLTTNTKVGSPGVGLNFWYKQDVVINESNHIRNVIATNGVINFSELDPDMKASSVTDVAGAKVQGNAFVGITGDKVTYKYKTGFQETSINVTLNVTNENTKSGWIRDNGMWRYRDENGFYYTGWHYMTAKEGEKIPHWSFFSADAFLITGWKYMNEAQGEKTPHWSYFGDNGWLRTGWQRMGTPGNPDGGASEHWSYFGANGWLRTNWVQLGKGTAEPDGNTARHWSYFGSNGWLRTNWVQLGEGTSEPDGNSARHWSYFGPNGWLRTGLQDMGQGTGNPDGDAAKHRSYFGDNGWLRTNQRLTLSGIKYNADGRGWLTAVR